MVIPGPLDDLVYADDRFHCVTLLHRCGGLHLVKRDGDGSELGVAICKAS